MCQYDYFPLIGELFIQEIWYFASILGAEVIHIEKGSLPELCDIDFILVVGSQTDLLNLLS